MIPRRSRAMDGQPFQKLPSPAVPVSKLDNHETPLRSAYLLEISIRDDGHAGGPSVPYRRYTTHTARGRGSYNFTRDSRGPRLPPSADETAISARSHGMNDNK